MSVRWGTAFAISCLLLLPAAGQAQQRMSVFPVAANGVVAKQAAAPAAIQQEQEKMKPEEEMGTSGFFLGIVSMIGGAAIASSFGQSSCPSDTEDKDCLSRYAYTGALIAGTLMTPLGVNLAAKHKHGLVKSYAVAAALGTALYYGMRAIPGKPVAMAPFMALPLDVIVSVRLQK